MVGVADILILSNSLALQELISQWPDVQAHCMSASNTDQAAQQLSVSSYDLFIMDVSAGLNSERLQDLQILCKGKIPVVMLVDNSLKLSDVLVAECSCVLHKPLAAAALFEAMTPYILSNETPLIVAGLYFFQRGRFLALNKDAKESEKLKLTEKEAAILQFLYKHDVVERDALLSGVWGYNAGIDTHTLETHVYRLRQKIADFFKGKDLILNESGGYTLKKE